MEIQSLSNLARQIRALPPGLIAIDGYHGVGKSTLARSISTLLGIRDVHVDSFLLPNRGTFVQSIRVSDLLVALQERPVLVESVCLLAVMERLCLKPDMLIYVKAAEPHPRTAHGGGPLADEVRDYHRKYRPIDVADLVYSPFTPAHKSSLMNETRSIDVDIAFIKAKTQLSIALAVGGMLALLIGLVLLLYGVTGQDHTLVKVANIEVSAGGLGGVVMTTSVLWAFFSYKSRPGYAQIRRFSETYGSDGAILERHQYMSTTQEIVDPPTRLPSSTRRSQGRREAKP
jgi:hypothetical protein